jgi:hypothetical protein
MFDHVKFGVSDYPASKAFFLKALELAFEHRGLTVRVEWEVDTNDREAYRVAEEHFFGAIGCL